MQPAFVVQQVALARSQAETHLMSYGCSPQLREVGLHHRVPARQPVEPQANGHPQVVVDGEHLCGVTVSGAEERGAGLHQRNPGLPITSEEVGVHGLPIGEQAFPTGYASLPAHKEHQTGRIGCAGAFGVRIEGAVAEPSKACPMRVASGVADRGEAVWVTVAVRHQIHDPGGKGEHDSARGKTVDSDQTRFPQPPRDRLFRPRHGEVDTIAHEDVGVRLINSAHPGFP